MGSDEHDLAGACACSGCSVCLAQQADVDQRSPLRYPFRPP